MDNIDKNELLLITSKKRKTTTNSKLQLDNAFSDIQNSKFVLDLANELDLQTAPFDHVFNTQKKTENKSTNNELSKVNSSIEYRFYSKIPKPDSNYLIKSDKYSDMSTKIPKPKFN